MNFDISGLAAGIFLIFVGLGYSIFDKKIPSLKSKKPTRKRISDQIDLNVFCFLKRDDLDLCEIVCRKWKHLIRQSGAILPKRELILAKPDESDKLGLLDEKGFVFAYNSANLQDLLYHGFVRRYDLFLNEESINEAKIIYDLIGQPLEVDQCLITTSEELDLAYIDSEPLKILLTKYMHAEEILFRNIKILLSENTLLEAENSLNIVNELEKFMRKKYKPQIATAKKLEIGRSEIIATHFFETSSLVKLLTQIIELDELDILISKENCSLLFSDSNLIKLLLSTLLFNVVVIGSFESTNELDNLFDRLLGNEIENNFNKNNLSSKNELIFPDFDGSFCICLIIIERFISNKFPKEAFQNILTHISCHNNCEAAKYGEWLVIESECKVFKIMELTRSDGYVLKITRLNPGRHFEIIPP